MFSVTLSSSLLVAALSASVAVAQTPVTYSPPDNTFPATAHAQKLFNSPADLPYRVDTDVGLIRGEQHGYNICNETTAGQDSLCQTAYFNSIDDFCLWGPPEYGDEVGNIEGIMVAYCTQPRHGTRLIPAGALQGLQWTQTPDYVQVVGFIDQTAINILRDDWGGEMDPHGADLRGNPMGGVVFSDAYDGTMKQVVEWHNFIGGHFFCFKACDPAGPDAEHYCEHIFDRIGCAYNAPNAAVNGTFESCEGENQDFPGTYTQDGQVMTYTQPEGPITSIPYTARIPASSNCVQHQSAELFGHLPSVARPDATAAPTNAPSGSGSGSATGGSTRTNSANTAANTGTTSGNANADTDSDNGASALAISGVTVLGVLFSAIFFA